MSRKRGEQGRTGGRPAGCGGGGGGSMGRERQGREKEGWVWVPTVGGLCTDLKD